MSLEDLGNIGEFVAAVAVIVSLIYLAVQIRHNTRSVQAATFRGGTELFADLQAGVSRNPQLAEVAARGSVSLSKLTPTERLQFVALTGHLFTVYEDLFFQDRHGVLDRDFWRSRQKNLVWYLAFPGNAEAWESNRDRFSPDFAAFVDDLRSRAAQKPGNPPTNQASQG